MKRAILSTLLLLPAPLLGQGVMVAPHAVVIQHASRSGSVTLYNPNPEPAEVSISLLYGYPVTDSAGQYRLEIVDAPDSAAPSAAGWLQAFPRRTRLGPLERQTVRILGRPPAGLPDGEYWARMVVSARGGQVPIGGVEDTTTIKVGLTLEVRTVIPVQYRKGKPTTGLELGALDVTRTGDTLAVTVPMRRTGNASYIGMLRAVLEDSAGHTVARTEGPLAVYFDLAPRYALPVAGLPAGSYRLKVALDNERDDLAADQLIHGPAVRDSVEVRLP